MNKLFKKYQIVLFIINYTKNNKLKIKINKQSICISSSVHYLYFVILNKKNYEYVIKSIRHQKYNALIVLISQKVTYRELFEKHLELLGIIDICLPFRSIKKELIDYLTYLADLNDQ